MPDLNGAGDEQTGQWHAHVPYESAVRVDGEALNQLRIAAHAAHYSVSVLARRLGRSERQLRRHFEACFRSGLKEYLDHLRAVRAAESLAGGASAKEVACEFYYHDAGHLNRALKRRLGLTPSQIIAQRRKGVLQFRIPESATASSLAAGD